jgi:hypothetical protein
VGRGHFELKGAQMRRIQRFIKNAGLLGCIQLGVFLLGLVIVTWPDFRTGLWAFTVPALILGFCISYLIRNLVFEHLQLARRIMNTITLLAIIVVAVSRGGDVVESPWLSIFVVGFIANYTGSYFWMLSDERLRLNNDETSQV